jgi:hypothetical protein
MSRKLVVSLLALALGGALVPGCGKQDEGERCDKTAAGNSDCDSGLVCVPANELVDKSTDRCCPPEGERISDSRCARSGTVGTGGTSGSGGSSSAGAPASEGGAPASSEGGAPAASEGGAPASEPVSGAGGA